MQTDSDLTHNIHCLNLQSSLRTAGGLNQRDICVLKRKGTGKTKPTRLNFFHVTIGKNCEKHRITEWIVLPSNTFVRRQP